MQYGICSLACVPVRRENSDTSEMVTQLLFGDHFFILEKQAKWSRICIAADLYEGWIDNKQFAEVSEKEYIEYLSLPDKLLTNFVEYVTDKNGLLIPLTMGANLKAAPFLGMRIHEEARFGKQDKDLIPKIAGNFLNAPYLWGGKSPFGLDCSGFTQIVYKIAGYHIRRDASQQSGQGIPLSFIEESEPGDLAFFDNQEGRIIHVGILLQDNHIIHAHGKVRIDRIDHMGIFNNDIQSYSHRLRLIKKII